jgi:hypothetical protein
MAELVCNIPSTQVWVRKEYLMDHDGGHGEYVKGVWVSAKSLAGRAFYFETYLPEYGALYDKLPISAFVAVGGLKGKDLPLHDLQFWNCMDIGVVAVQKQFIGSMRAEVRLRTGGSMFGSYQFTLDNYHSSPDYIDCSTSETPSEHKSFNCIELDNGQYALYPNNRMRLVDISLTPKEVKVPDFKVSTREYQVERVSTGEQFGETEKYFY